MATADIGHLGDVNFGLRQGPWSIEVLEAMAFGSLMLIVGDPRKFSLDANVLTASQTAIREVAVESVKQVTSVAASVAVLGNYPQAVKVDFTVTFASPQGRQTFARDMARDGGNALAKRISEKAPSPYTGTCLLPGLGDLPLEVGNMYLNLERGAVSEEAAPTVGHSSGSLVLTPTTVTVKGFLRDPLWQECVAMSIANIAEVSRLQVGTVIAADSQTTLLVDFWLSGSGTLSSKGVNRVLAAGSDAVMIRAFAIYKLLAALRLQPGPFVAHSRVVLYVPSAQTFAKSNVAAVQQALIKDSDLLKKATLSVTLTALSKDAVRVGVTAAFASASDRQVFFMAIALDGAKKFARSVNNVPACGGKCRLQEAMQMPMRHGEAAKLASLSLTDALYYRLAVEADSAESRVGNPAVQDALAQAFADMASVHPREVGISAFFRHTGNDRVAVFNFWVASPYVWLREAAVKRVTLLGEPAMRRLRQLI